MVNKGGTSFMHLTELQAWTFFHIFFQAWAAKAEVFLLPLASANPRESPGFFFRLFSFQCWSTLHFLIS